jgi:hypothetical protein
VRALHLGDFGDRSCQQREVAGGMAAAHARAPFQLGFSVGDLVYECGPDETLPGAAACAFADDGNAVPGGFAPPADPAFDVHDGPLAFLGAAQVYTVLGNHDVGLAGRCLASAAQARAKACLNVARRTPRWSMPGRHYVVDAGPARFIVVDSNLLVADYGGFTLADEVAFVRAQAAGCDERTCFLVGHHPPVTAGVHRSEATHEYLSRVALLLGAGGGRIRAWLAGHDHDLQHLRAPGGLDVFVSGAGSRGRLREKLDRTSVDEAELLFGSARWGYGVVEVWPGGWAYRFEDHRAERLYCCAASGAGRCEPNDCR